MPNAPDAHNPARESGGAARSLPRSATGFVPRDKFAHFTELARRPPGEALLEARRRQGALVCFRGGSVVRVGRVLREEFFEGVDPGRYGPRGAELYKHIVTALWIFDKIADVVVGEARPGSSSLSESLTIAGGLCLFRVATRDMSEHVDVFTMFAKTMWYDYPGVGRALRETFARERSREVLITDWNRPEVYAVHCFDSNESHVLLDGRNDESFA